jgi:hypothetical protein
LLRSTYQRSYTQRQQAERQTLSNVTDSESRTNSKPVCEANKGRNLFARGESAVTFASPPGGGAARRKPREGVGRPRESWEPLYSRPQTCYTCVQTDIANSPSSHDPHMGDRDGGRTNVASPPVAACMLDFLPSHPPNLANTTRVRHGCVPDLHDLHDLHGLPGLHD